MASKMLKTSVIILAAVMFLLCLCFTCHPISADNTTWKLGDDIVPTPIYDKSVDCDDADLYSYLFLTYSEYDVKIMYGNLKLKHESFDLCNHYWLVVNSDNIQYPYDSGYCIRDEQHLEGFVVSYGKLLYWAKEDQR